MKNSTIIKVPSKTFLVGEYLAVVGGPAVLLATEPEFLVSAVEQDSISLNSGWPKRAGEAVAFERVDEQSAKGPLARLFQRVNTKLAGEQKPSLSFWIQDPHRKRGGFGRSGAEFLALCHFARELNGKDQAPARLLDLFRSCGGQGSGADLVAQALGGITAFESQVGESRTLASQWPFPLLEISIFRTGVKVSNHDGLDEPSDLVSARAIVVRTIRAITAVNERDLVQSVSDYRNWMLAQNVEHRATTELLDLFQKDSRWLAAKGCGALGADVILGLNRPENRESLEGFLGLERVCVVATGQSLVPGVLSQ